MELCNFRKAASKECIESLGSLRIPRISQHELLFLVINRPMRETIEAAEILASNCGTIV